MIRISLGALGALLLASAGCAAAAGPSVGPEGGGSEGVEIRIENRTPLPLRVLALYGGSETPLGRVAPLAASSVRLPHGTGTFRLVARPSVRASVTPRHHVSEPIQVLAGQRVTWQLQASPGVADVPHLSIVRVLACRRGGC